MYLGYVANQIYLLYIYLIYNFFDQSEREQEGQKCPKRQVAQAAIRLATAVIKFRNGNVDSQTDK